MSDPGECRQVRPALGVYLLGAIGPAERVAADSHLAGCADCREELAGLASLVGRLGTVSAADVVMLAAEADEDPGGAGDGGTRVLLRRAAWQRRRRIWRRSATAGAIVALAAAAAAAGIPAMSTPPLPRVALPATALYWPETVHGSNPASGAGAIIRYRARPWGVQIVVQVSGILAGTHCELRVLTATGQEATAASWTVAAFRSTAWYPASAPFAEGGVRDFLVMSADQTLVSVRAR